VKKHFKELLSNSEQEREKEFLSILNWMIAVSELTKNKKLLSQIQKFSSYKIVLDDTEVINYSAWLKSKIKKVYGNRV